MRGLVDNGGSAGWRDSLANVSSNAAATASAAQIAAVGKAAA